MKAFSFALFLLALPAAAEDKPNLDPTAPAIPGAVAMLVSAQSLYALGQARKDPLMVLTAARMMGDLALIPADRTPVSTGKPGPVTMALPDADAMLATARALADGGDMLPDLIESVATEAQVQPKSLQVTPSRLDPAMADTWTLPFYGGTYAELAILGAGQGNLDLRVTDADGNPVCQDSGSADTAICGFTPRDNGEFTATITNAGDAADSYSLITN